MAETENTAAAAPEQPQVRQQILAQFVRDLSFENIMSQKGVQSEVEPEISVQVNLDVRKRQVENQYEVITKFHITNKNKKGDDVLFDLEMEYVTIFHIEGLPEDQMMPFLFIECPRQMFPFVRRIVSDVTRDGGFPPLNLEQIDWVALFQSEMMRRSQEAKAAADAPKPN